MQELDQINQQLETVQAQLDLQVQRAKLDALNDMLFEGDAFGFRDRGDDYRGANDQPVIGAAHRMRGFASVYDRSDGKHLPFYEFQDDLRRMWSRCRTLANFDALFWGASQALNVYVMGGAWDIDVIARDGVDVPDPLLQRCNAILKRFDEDNDWSESLDSEIHDASREDGDCIVALHPRPNGRARAHLFTAERNQEPANPHQLNEWLGCNAIWNFGVQAPYCDQINTYDYAHAAGYHIVHDDTGSQWDYLPRQPMRNLPDTRCGTQIKRNTSRAAARGWSDYAPIVDSIEGELKLRRGTRIGATVMSHIAYIVENAEGVGKGNAIDSDAASILLNRVAQKATNQTTSIGQKYMPPGSQLSIGNGQKYHASPMGSSHAPIFMDVAQFGLRMIGVRWLMPEYMITGDASNANYASSVQSASPFIKAREKDQSAMIRSVTRIMKKVLRMAYLAGVLDDVVGSWADLMGMVEISVNAPQVASDDKLAEVQRSAILHEHGILDSETWATQAGLDPDKVTAPMAAVSGGTAGVGSDPMGSGGPGQTQPSVAGEYSAISRQQWQRNRKAINDITDELISGTMSEVRARAMLSSLGLAKETVDAILADATDGAVDGPDEETRGEPLTQEQRYTLAERLLFEGYP